MPPKEAQYKLTVISLVYDATTGAASIDLYGASSHFGFSLYSNTEHFISAYIAGQAELSWPLFGCKAAPEIRSIVWKILPILDTMKRQSDFI